jgi:molybdopterin converting factor small subunit
MRVSIGFLGMLRDQLGQKSLVVDLPDGAGVADFMDAIAPLMEQKAAWAWDSEKRRFSARVVVTKQGAAGGQGTFDPDIPFADGDEILVFMPIAGG